MTGYASLLIPALLLAYSPARAGDVITLEGENVRTIEHEGATDFNIKVKHDGFGSLEFYVERTVNSLPDDNWFSTICMDDYCYRDTESKTEPVSVASGDTYKVKFSVYTGDKDATGHFELKMMTTGPGGGEFGTLDFTVTAGEVSSVPLFSLGHSAPYPSPAIQSVTLPGLDGNNFDEVQIVDAAGNTVLTTGTFAYGNFGVTLDVSTLPSGSYFYRTIGGESIETGRFLIAR